MLSQLVAQSQSSNNARANLIYLAHIRHDYLICSVGLPMLGQTYTDLERGRTAYLQVDSPMFVDAGGGTDKDVVLPF